MQAGLPAAVPGVAAEATGGSAAEMAQLQKQPNMRRSSPAVRTTAQCPQTTTGHGVPVTCPTW